MVKVMGLTTLGLTRLGITALQVGVLEWNLPERQTYQAGQPLAVSLRVTNPTDAAREYQLYLGLFDPQTGQLIQDTLSLVTVDSAQSFTVAAGSYVEMEGDITVDRTNVILGLMLYDVATQTVVSQVSTLLEAAGAGIWEQLMPLMGGVLAIGMVGAMVPMATRMFKKE